jgi:hypothetical protein
LADRIRSSAKGTQRDPRVLSGRCGARLGVPEDARDQQPGPRVPSDIKRGQFVVPVQEPGRPASGEHIRRGPVELGDKCVITVPSGLS